MFNKMLLVFIGIFASTILSAATITVQWTHPTTYVDGSPLAIGSIQQTRVEYGTCSGALFGTKLGEVVATGSSTQATTPNLTAGTYCVRAYSKAGGVESNPTNVAQAVVPVPAPNAPTNLTVTVN